MAANLMPVMEGLLLASTLLFAGAMAGLTAGLFGNGGGFVVVPALLFVFSFLGYQDDGLIYVAVGTSLATIVVSSFRAALTHHKLGSLDREVLRTWAPWLTIGVAVGVYLASQTDAKGLTLVFAGGVGFYQSISYSLPCWISTLSSVFQVVCLGHPLPLFLVVFLLC